MNDKCLLLSNNQNSHENNENNADNSGDSIGNRMTASKSQPDISLSSVFKASMLIAGTTVGGGFLALPQTVVVPLGGLTVSMASLFGVWAFFLVQSLVLVDCVLECKKNVTKTNQVDSSDSIGIPILATYALGEKGAAFAATLLIILTEATIVSQISRAGSLVAGFGPASTLRQYRIGCIVATLVGAGLSFGGDVKPRKDKQEKDYQGDNNLKRAAEQTIDESSKTITGSNRTFAANANAILTVIFLLSAALLFQTGSQTADWSRCFTTSSSSAVSSKPLTQSIWSAIPTMLQLLAYGEILPNVCSMLQYHGPSIRKAIVFGAAIPLILLSGWAALGLALLPATSRAAGIDPVNILLATGGDAIRSRLLILAVSAIGATIIGSFLALESAYDDLTAKTTIGSDGSTYSRSSIMTSESTGNGKRGRWWRQWRRLQKSKSQVMKAVAIIVPPMAISAISPNVFLQAIDFAGSYPVLLIWGVFPTLMAWIIRRRSLPTKTKSDNVNSVDPNQYNHEEKEFQIQPWVYAVLGLLSAAMISINAFQDIASIYRFFAFGISLVTVEAHSIRNFNVTRRSNFTNIHRS